MEDSLNLYRLSLLYLVNLDPNKVEAWVCSHSAFNDPRQLQIILPLSFGEKKGITLKLEQISIEKRKEK